MLARLFIRDYKDVNNERVRKQYGILSSIVGIVANTVLSLSKIIIGTIFFSIAIVADGMNNLTDAGSSIVTLIGFKISSKPADNKHPFGHARIEYVASMIIAFIILFLGIELAVSSVKKLIDKSETVVTILMMVVLGVSIIIKLGMFFYYRSIAKKIKSDTFKIASIDSLNDIISTTAVLISSIVIYFTGVNIDGYVGLVVAIVIFLSGVQLFKKTISPLLGERPPEDFVKHIAEKIKTYDGVLGIHDLEVHNYGPNQYHASVHVEVDARENIMKSHDMVDSIERDLKEDGIDFLIHIDPIIVDDDRINALRILLSEVLSEYNDNMTYHDFRVVYGKNSRNLIFDLVVPCDVKLSDDEIIDDINNRLREKDSLVNATINIDRNYTRLN